MRTSLTPICLWAAAAAAAALDSTTSLALQIGQPRMAAQQQGGSASASASAGADPFQAVVGGVPPWTRATLAAGAGRQIVSAPVTAGGQFVFADVPAGSYLAEVQCATHFFPPMRVDVWAEEGDALLVSASETYRGNDWDNRGETLVRLDSVDTAATATAKTPARPPTFVVRPLSAQPKVYYAERSSFSALSILRNPMILLAIVSMGIMFGMPYLVENMDPEMRAEWEERQKSSPVNSLLSGGSAGSAPGAPNFDMAAYLAGSKSTGSGGGSSGGNSGSNGSGSGKKNNRR